MSVNNFIPEIWSAAVMETFHEKTMITSLANRQYEGDLVAGSKVHIGGTTGLTVKDYKTGVNGARTTKADAVDSTGIELLIDQEKAIDFKVDDVDRRQANADLDIYSAEAATALAEDTETFLAKLLLTTGTDATSKIGATAVTNAEKARDAILKLRTQLTRAKVPQVDRWLVINPAFEERLLGGDSKLVDTSYKGDSLALAEAILGRLHGFNVFTSSFVDSTNVDHPVAIAFYAPALAYVSQLQKMEGLRAEDSFADRIRGLHVYGGKVIRPTAVQVFKATA